jgi:hypothetical protein
MNFDDKEILLLTEEDWLNVPKNKPFHQQKGLAIDAAIKRIFGNAGSKYAMFDMDFKLDEIGFHDVKSSSTMKSFTISDGEFNNSLRELEENNQDTLYWLFEQLPARNEYRFVGLVRFSSLYVSNEIRASKFGSGYFFSPLSSSPLFLK